MSRILPTDSARRTVGEEVFRQISDALSTLNIEPPPRDDSDPQTERAISLLRKSGAFSIGYSSRLGGPGFTAVEQTEIVSLIARYDASVAWRVMVGMDGGLFSNYLDPDVVHAIVPDQKAIFAGVLAPNGTSKELPRGYEISGRWSMASGIASAEMVFAGFKTPDGQSRVAILPSDGILIVNDWDSTGLRSSDSNTFIIDKFYVSREATFSWKDSAELPGPLSSPDLQMRKFPGVAIGVTRAALDYARRVANEKESTKNGPWRDSYRVQYTIGECEMLYIAMRESVYGTLDKRWSLLSRGKPYAEFSPDEKIDTVAARVFAIRQAREIIRKLYDLFGASSVYCSNPLDRWLRDIETMNQHFLGSSVAIQSAGALVLGGSPESDLIVREV